MMRTRTLQVLQREASGVAAAFIVQPCPPPRNQINVNIISGKQHEVSSHEDIFFQLCLLPVSLLNFLSLVLGRLWWNCTSAGRRTG